MAFFPSFSLSLVKLVTLACRALRRVDCCTLTASGTSRLALRNALVRDARVGCGEVGFDGGCGVGVLWRVDARTLLRSAMMLAWARLCNGRLIVEVDVTVGLLWFPLWLTNARTSQRVFT